MQGYADNFGIYRETEPLVLDGGQLEKFEQVLVIYVKVLGAYS